MKGLRIAALILCALLIGSSGAYAKANTVDMFTDAAMTANIPVLEKILAPNFWYIGANGHIRDKEHFIKELKDKELVINRISLMNERETSLGTTRLLTANGSFTGHFTSPLPNGLMRYTMVLADNKGEEQVVLFQATPVIATSDCSDGNCKIK